MTDKLLTILTVNHNSVDALALMRESFLHHHPDLADKTLFYGWDNGSTDGAREYMMKHWHHVHTEPENDEYGGLGHGADALSRLVETPYCCLVDSDVEFVGSSVLITQDNELAVLTKEPFSGFIIRDESKDSFGLVGPETDCLTLPPSSAMGTVNLLDYYGNPVECKSIDRIDTAFALWRTDKLQWLLSHGSSWGRAHSIDNRWFADGGGMLFRDALLAGMRIERVESLRESVKHYGQVGMQYPECNRCWVGNDSGDVEDVREAARQRYAVIQERLKELRNRAVL